MKKFLKNFMLIALVFMFGFLNINKLNAKEGIEVQTVEDSAFVAVEDTNNLESLEPGETDGEKDATIIPQDQVDPNYDATTDGDSREAEVTINIDSEPFTETTQVTTYDTVDVALVLDASGSMTTNIQITVTDEYGNTQTQTVTRIAAAKMAAINLATELLNNNTEDDIYFRISLTIFNNNGSVINLLTTDLNEITDAINGINTTNSTNVQDGINKGGQTLYGSSNDKVIVLLTDGETNASTDNVNPGTGYKDSDNEINYTWTGGSYSYTNAAKAAADFFKTDDNYFVTFYTIGLGTNTNANNLLKYIAGEDIDEEGNGLGTYSRFLTANDGDELLEAFDAIVENITTTKYDVATNVVLTDIIPNDFTLTQTEQDNLKTAYGTDKVTIETVSEGTKITYAIGTINALTPITFNYKIVAKNEYHGSMYTNFNTILTGTPASGNEFTYTLDGNGKFNLVLDKPSVVVPAIAENDNAGTVRSTETKEITIASIVANDNNSNYTLGTELENAASLTDTIEIVSSTTNGTLSLNSAKTAFIYTPTLLGATSDSFTYRIFTKVLVGYDNNNDPIYETVKSNVATVTLTIEKVMGNVTVYYVEKDNHSNVLDTETLSTAQAGTSYTTNSKPIPNWTFTEVTPSNASGTYIDGMITVYYEYTKTMGTLDVRHVWMDGSTEVVILAEDQRTEQQGTAYTTNPLDTTTYNMWRLITTPSNASGSYTDGNTTVTYVYEKIMGTVVAHYVDENGNTLSADVTTTGQVNVDSYNTIQKTITNWTFKEIESGSASVSGTYTNGILEVTYVYEETMGTLDVRHVWMDGSTEVVILAEDQRTEQQGTAYTTNPLDTTTYNMWRLITTPSNASGSYTDGNTTVTYVYEKVMGTVIVKYIEKDNSSNEISLNTITTEQVGTSYTTSPASIPNWTFTGTIPGNANGNYIDGSITVYYEYTKTLGTVIIHYVEVGTNTVISPNDYTMGQVNVDTYTTSPKPISNWTYIGVHSGSASVNGTYAEGDTNVIYTYTKTLGTVVAHYVDENGNTLSADVTTTGQVNVDSYNTIQKTITNWTFKEIESGSASVSGTYTNGILEVTYVYEETMGTLDVRHVWMDGSTEVVILAEDQRTEQQGTAYTTNPLDTTTYNMWRLITTPSNASGSYTDGNTTVTYVYEKVMGNVTVYYVEKDNHSNILDSETLPTAQVGTVYTTNLKIIANWTFTGTIPMNALGRYIDGMITVYYEYTKTLGTVVAHYVDEEGNTLSADVTTTGQVNVDTYTTSQKTITNWTFKEIESGSASVSGTYTNGILEVTYVYEETMGTLDVRHVWMDGSTEVVILAEDQRTEQQGTAYTTNPLDTTTYNMWRLITTPSNASGSYTDGNTTVTYVYEKVMGNVIVYYVEKDNHSNVLNTVTLASGQLGTSYTTSPASIPNWTFTEVTPSNASGIYTNGMITVYYEYTKTLGTVKTYYVDENGDGIIPYEITTGQINVDTYTTSQKTIPNWTFKEIKSGSASESGTYANGTLEVTYVYEKTMGTVKIYYVDEVGNSIVDYSTTSGQINVDTYTTSPKSIPNWTYLEVHSASAPVNGTYIEGTLEVIYVYSKTMGTLDVRHVWMDGSTEVVILAEDQRTEQQGTAYTTNPLDTTTYNMWRLITIPSNALGSYTDGNTTVTYVYEKVMGKLIVNYFDENGKELIASETYEEQIGNMYEVTPKEIDGYILLKVEGSESGSYVEDDTVVNYIYELAGVGGDEPTDTGVENSILPELMYVISSLSLIGSLIIKKKLNN